MTKTTMIAVTLVLMAILTMSQMTFSANAVNKVTVCHQGQNGDKTIQVPEQKLQSHLDHGDYEGECIGQKISQANYQSGFLDCGESNENAVGVLYIKNDDNSIGQQIAQCSYNEENPPLIDMLQFDPPRDSVGFVLGCNDGQHFKDVEAEFLRHNTLGLLEASCNLPGKGQTTVNMVFEVQ